MMRYVLSPAGFLLLLTSPVLAIDLMKQDEAKIKREVWDPVVKTMPTKYAGTVYLDGSPLAGVRVTDGIHFVKTDENGRYEIEVKFDAMTPYLPARVISVSWPDGVWPVKHELTGRMLYWRRVKDVQETPDKVDFLLTKPTIKPLLVISLGADPHGNLWDNWGYVMPQEVKRAGNHVHLGMLLGDLTYADLKGVVNTFPHFEKYAREFPGPFLHVMGNHDIPGPFFGAHELAGNGSFHKWLGPVRMSFDVAGVHVLLFNYWLVNQQAVDWLYEELSSVPADKPVYIFTHMWGPYLGPVCDRFPNIRLVTAGHTHKTRYCGKQGNAEYWTFYAFYRLLYIDGSDHEFIDRRAGEHALYNYYAHRVGAKGSRVSELTEMTLTNASSDLKGYSLKDAAPDQNAPFGASEQYDVTFAAMPAGSRPATRLGLRITNERGYVFKFYYDVASKRLNLAGRETYFDPEPVVARMPTKHPPKEVWDSYRTVDTYIKADANFRNQSEEKAKYQAALAAEKKWLTVDRQKIFEAWRKKQKPVWPIRFDINVCPDRIQAFVNNNIPPTAESSLAEQIGNQQMRTAVAAWITLCAVTIPVTAMGRTPFKNYWDEAKIQREISDDKVFPQYKKWIDVAKKTPTAYSGTVTLDGKPLAGVRVTDGIHFVKTDENGRYAIEVKFDAMTPYLPARTISISWPEGTCPVAEYKSAKTIYDAYKKTDKQRAAAWLKKESLNKTVSFEINVCPGRIQTFVNQRVSCIQFYKIGRPVQIEYFAEGGEATFESVKVMEDGAGFVWEKFTRPVLNHLP